MVSLSHLPFDEETVKRVEVIRMRLDDEIKPTVHSALCRLILGLIFFFNFPLQVKNECLLKLIGETKVTLDSHLGT